MYLVITFVHGQNKSDDTISWRKTYGLYFMKKNFRVLFIQDENDIFASTTFLG